jgi:MFS family permease
MLGATTAGPVQDRFGRRASFLLGAIFSAAGVAVVYTASTPEVFLAGKIVNGLSLGICLTTGQTYISEVSPMQIRGIALSAFTFCMVRTPFWWRWPISHEISILTIYRTLDT